MNIKQIHYIITLSQCGTFAAAADALNISQPSLSQYVKKLETQLGVQLFDRTGASVRLTDAGRIYIEAGQKILDLERQMRGRLNDLTDNKIGTIVVGTSPYRSALMMPAVAKRLKERYSGMSLVVEEMTSRELLEATEHGQFDLCLTMLPVDERLFCYEKITEEEMLVAVPNGFPPIPAKSMPDRKYPAIDAADLNDQPFVMITEGQFMQKTLSNLAIDYQLTFRQMAVVKSLDAQIAMVRAGIGMALLPSGIERLCSPDEVRFYSLKQTLPKREVVVMWRKDSHLNNVTKELIEIMKEIVW